MPMAVWLVRQLQAGTADDYVASDWQMQACTSSETLYVLQFLKSIIDRRMRMERIHTWLLEHV